MCVCWGLGQSISVQTYLYVGAERDVFTEIFPENQLESGIWPSRKLASRVLYWWRDGVYQRVNRTWEASRRGGEWNVLGAWLEQTGGKGVSTGHPPEDGGLVL